MKRFLFCIVCLFFVSNVFGVTTWNLPFFDSGNTAFKAIDINYPILSDSILVSGGNIIFDGMKNDYPFSYLSYTSNCCQLMDKEANLYGPFLSLGNSMLYQNGNFYVEQDIHQRKTRYIASMDINNQIKARFLTGLTPLEGTDLVWMVKKRKPDPMDNKNYDIIFYNPDGFISKIPIIQGGQSRNSVISISNYIVSIGAEGTFNLKTGKKISDDRIIVDGKIALENNKKGGTRVKDIETGEIKFEIGEWIRKVNSDSLEGWIKLVEGKPIKFDYNSRQGYPLVVRYSKEDGHEIERFIVNMDKPENYYLKDTFEHYALVSNVYYDVYTIYQVREADSGKIVFERTIKTDNSFDKVKLYNGYIIYQTDTGIEIYDLRNLDKDGSPKLVKKILWPPRTEIQVEGDKFFIASPIDDKVKIDEYFPYFTQGQRHYFVSNPGFSRMFNTFGYCFNIIDDGVWYVKLGNKPRLENNKEGNKEPDKVFELKLEDPLVMVSNPVWFDNNFYFSALSKGENGYEVDLYITDFESKIKKILLFIPDQREYCFEHDFLGSIAVNSSYVTAEFDGFTTIYNQKTGDCKILESSSSDRPALLKDHYLCNISFTGSGNLYDIDTLSNVANGVFLGCDEDSFYFLKGGQKPDELYFKKVTNGKSQSRPIIDLFESIEFYISYSTTFNNVIIADPYAFNKDGDIIQQTPLYSDAMIDLTPYIPIGDKLIRRCGASVVSYKPCPTFSVKRKNNSDDKPTFSFTNTRQDDLDLVLKGEAYLASWGDDGKPPIFTKLDEPHHKLGPLVPGMSQEITFDLPKPLEFDGKKSEGNYFALIVESNGLLDTKNSELSDFDKEGRPLFDGTPLSLDKQHALVLTVWKR